jgi:nicotinate phosphoribosyltransferase
LRYEPPKNPFNLLNLFNPLNLRFNLRFNLFNLRLASQHWQTKTYNNAVVLELCFRKTARTDHYIVNAALQKAINDVQNFRFSPDYIQKLGALRNDNGRPEFDESFLNYLQRLTFNCSIFTPPEGTILYENDVLARIEGALLPAQLLAAGVCTQLSVNGITVGI